MNTKLFEKIYKMSEMAAATAKNLRQFIKENPEVYKLYKKGNDKTPEEKAAYEDYINKYYELNKEDDARNPAKSRSKGFADAIFPVVKQMENPESKHFDPSTKEDTEEKPVDETPVVEEEKKEDVKSAEEEKPAEEEKVSVGSDWDYFDKFEAANDKYLPAHGDGDNMATQAVTAVCKLVYKWFNDGDVYDNHFGMEGWVNDISGSANWLYEYVPETRKVLKEIEVIGSDSHKYTQLLKDLADIVYSEDLLTSLEGREKIGDAYSEDGYFSFDDTDDYEEDDSWEEEEDDYWNDDDDDSDESDM